MENNNTTCVTTTDTAAGHTPQHYVLVSSPGMGHLIPFLELAKRISQTHHIKCSILLVSTRSSNSEQESRLLNSLSSTYLKNNSLIDLTSIPAVDISNMIDPDADIVWKVAVIMRETRPAIKAAMEGLTSPKPTAVILDMFATESLGIAWELGLPGYFYCTSSAWVLALMASSPLLDSEVKGEFVDQPEPIKIYGCKSISPADIIEPMVDRSTPQYRVILRVGSEIPKFDGFIVNTWHDLDRSAIAGLREDEVMREIIRKQPVFAVGPLTKETDPMSDDHSDEELIEWMDRQPHKSVLYVSFGSGGNLSSEQMLELAWGLERSQQKFVWIVRPPIDSGDAGAFYFGLKDGDPSEIDRFLPPGFMERTKDRGFVIKQWGPQGVILKHPATGGFLSHCGWNSTLDGVTNGVPMIAWPLFAEQRMNAAMLADQGVAISGNDGDVGNIGINPGHEPAMEDLLINGRGGVENYIPQDQLMEVDLDDIGLSSLFTDPEFPPGFEPTKGPSVLEDDPEEAAVIEEARQTLIFAKQLGCIVPDEKLTLSNYEGIIRNQRASYCRRSHDESDESKEESERCSRRTSKEKGKKGRGAGPRGFSKFSRASKVVMRGKKKTK